LDAKGYAEKANANTIVVLNVEGKEGLKNLNEIVKTKGVDVVFIGPYDLSHSIGKPGQVEDKEVINSIKNSVKVIKDSGMACGSYSHTLEYMDILIDCGVQYVTYTVDSALVAQSYKQVYERFSRKMKKR
jgi:4-hydroxy-2-oxoheptanedioate aldolase